MGGGPVPQPEGKAETKAEEEAGFVFQEAVNLADRHEYDKAVEELRRAREVHRQRRRAFQERRGTLNKFSDPNEDIFLQCCDYLEAYWKLRKRLKEENPDLRRWGLRPTGRWRRC
jgi:hypothetical protein